MKKCNKCNKELNYTSFYKNKSSKDGLGYVCKECDKKRKKKYNKGPFVRKCIVCQKDFLSRLSNGKFCSKNCRNKFNINRLIKYCEENNCKEKYIKSDKRKKYIRNYNREKRKKDFMFKLNEQISGAIYKHLKKIGSSKKGKSWKEFVSFDLKNLKEHIENQFTEEMNWHNYGSYWHIDHIIPKSIFKKDFFYKCWNLKNLRPLEKTKNIFKGNKINIDLIKKYNIEYLMGFTNDI
jgi:prolyl oligopeptidase PreP (S9A serine peptidase family)